jgi:hypothetical protein
MEAVMKSKAIWALAVVNVLLLASLCLRSLTPSAHAQMARPSDYIMIPADVVGGSNAVIYMIDTREGMLNARTLDLQGNALIDLGAPIDLKRVLGGGRGR